MSAAAEFSQPVLKVIQDAQKSAGTAHSMLARALRFNEPVQRYRQRFARLQDIRRPMENKWRQVRDLLDPAATRYLDGDLSTWDECEIDDSQILDTTPRKMAQTAADGLYGGLASPSERWATLYVGDYEKFDADASHAEKAYLDLATECCMDTLANSNFYTAVHPFRKEVLEFGVSLMLAYSDPVSIVKFFPYTVGSFWLAQNSRRDVDTVATRTIVTAMDLAVTYGWSKLPRTVKDAIEKTGNPDTKFSLIQMIQPWDFFGSAGANPEGFEYEDVHFIEDCDDRDAILYRGGFRTKPFIVARWSESFDLVYPRTCPGIDALPDIRQLYESTKIFTMAVEWAGNPAWLKHIGVQADYVKPGDIIEVTDFGSKDPMRPLLPAGQVNFEGNIRLRQMLIENISATFYNREIMMVSARAQQGHQMTATEVDQLRSEKNAVMGPITARQSEPNKDVLDRTYELITQEWAILEAPPESLIGKQIKPYFTSDMAVMQRQVRLMQINDLLAATQAMMTIDPNIRHTLDLDRVIREYERRDMVPAFAFHSPEEVEQLIQQDRQMRQQLAQAQQMQMMAKAGKDLGATPTTGDNAAAVLAEEMGVGA